MKSKSCYYYQLATPTLVHPQDRTPQIVKDMKQAHSRIHQPISNHFQYFIFISFEPLV